MARYPRITGKVFGRTASASGDDPQIGEFGSALTGQYNGTGDVSVIQGNSAWDNGFISCVTPTNQYPPLPEMTGFGKVLSQQICYLLQQGVAEYDSGTEYYTGNWCSYNGSLYIAKSDGFSNKLPTNTTYWNKFTGGFSRNLGEIVTSSLPLTDTTLHLADGSLLSQQDYPEFTSYIANLYNSLPSGEFSPAAQNSTLGNDSWSSIAYGNGLYIAVSLNNEYATSSDGTNWNTPVAFSSEVSNARAICFDGTQFVLLDYNGNIFTTTNGTSWTKVTRIDQYFTDGKDIAYGNGVYIVITTGGEVWKSTNLSSFWITIGGDYTGTGTTVEFVNDVFVIVFKSQFTYTIYWNSDGTQILTNWNKTVGNNNNIINNYCCILYENEYKLINEYGYVYTTNNLSSGFSSGVQDTNLGSHTWASYASNSSGDITMISSTGYISQKQSPITYVFTTEADWQATYTTYGECGKYVYNSTNNTVRIPLYNTYLTNTVNPQKLGNLTPASIPNIKGVISANERLYKSGTSVADYGAFNNYAQNVVSGQSDNTNFDNDLWDFDASRVSSVYSDDATTVNTQSIKQLVYIVVKQ